MPPCKPIIEFSYKPQKHKRKEMRPETTLASVWGIMRLNCCENGLNINKCLPHGNLKSRDAATDLWRFAESMEGRSERSCTSLFGIPLKHANYPLASARDAQPSCHKALRLTWESTLVKFRHGS